MARAKVDIQLRWGDEDAYGHINNVAFLRYLEEARVRILWSGSGHEKTGMEGHFRGDTPGGLKTLVVDHRMGPRLLLPLNRAPTAGPVAPSSQRPPVHSGLRRPMFAGSLTRS